MIKFNSSEGMVLARFFSLPKLAKKFERCKVRTKPSFFEAVFFNVDTGTYSHP